VEFIETPEFTEAVNALEAEDQLQKLQASLSENPESGALLPRTGGCRKIRMALPGRGKSGGARVIYFYLARHHVIFLLLIYSKNVQDTLSHKQENSLRAITSSLKT
jgi:hypothetical protein